METSADTGRIDSLKEEQGKAQREGSNRELVIRWLDELELSRKDQDDYLERVDKIHKRYRDEREARHSGGSRFSFLWANVQSMQPVIYSRLPKPVAERNFKKRDPVTMRACEMLERNLTHSMVRSDFHNEMLLVRDDCILGARGVSWERYVPIFGPIENTIYLQPIIDQMSGLPTGGWLNADTQEPVELQPGETPRQDPQNGGYVITRQEEGVVDELAITDFVHRTDFRHNKARKWKDEVRWVARRSFLDKDTFAERFDKPEEGKYLSKKVKADHCPKGLNEEQQKNEIFKKYTVWELWDKESHCIYWLSPAYKDDFLDHVEDFLKVEKFFPCARPVLWNITSDSLIPTPDFIHLQDLADELDDVTDRIQKLTKTIKLVTMHDAAHPELAHVIKKAKEFDSIPMKNWADFVTKGGFQGALAFLPVAEMTAALEVLYGRQTTLKQELYEISGQSDLTRGQSNPEETATAQQLKSQYSSQRMDDRQRSVAEHIRDALTIKGEIICEHFTPERIIQIADENPEDPLTQQAVQLLKDEKMRGFKITIETDSTVAVDEDMDKQRRTELGDTMTSFMERLLPLLQQDPELAPVPFAILKHIVRGYRCGRDVEQIVDETLDRKMEAIQQMLAEPAPDPAQQELEANLQLAQQELEGEMSIQQQKLQGDQQLAAQKLAAELQLDVAESQTSQQAMMVKAQQRPQPQAMYH